MLLLATGGQQALLLLLLLGGGGGARPPPPRTHGQQPLQLGPEAVVEPAVDEGVVAGAAHGQPVEGEVEGVVGVDGSAGEQEHVAVEREPAHGEHHHHRHQHLDGALPLAPLQEVLLARHVADSVPAPQAARHTQVGTADDEEGQDVKQDEGGQVQILPEDVRGFGKIRHTEAADDVFTVRFKQKDGRQDRIETNIMFETETYEEKNNRTLNLQREVNARGKSIRYGIRS